MRLYGIVEPQLQKVPLTLLLATLEVTPPPSPDQNNMVVSETTLELRSNSGLKKTMVFEEFILKT